MAKLKRKHLKGWYNSTSDFVNQNKLKKEAKALWGEDWEQEDDTEQIQELLNHLGFDDLSVKCNQYKEHNDIKVSTFKIKLSKKEFVEILRETFLAGNNFGVENPNNDDDYNEAETKTIEKVLTKL